MQTHRSRLSHWDQQWKFLSLCSYYYTIHIIWHDNGFNTFSLWIHFIFCIHNIAPHRNKMGIFFLYFLEVFSLLFIVWLGNKIYANYTCSFPQAIKMAYIERVAFYDYSLLEFSFFYIIAPFPSYARAFSVCYSCKIISLNLTY